MAEDIIYEGGKLMRNFLKLQNQKQYISQKDLMKEYAQIYKGISALADKNDKQKEFKYYCLALIKSKFEMDFPNIFKNLKDKNKNKNNSEANYINKNDFVNVNKKLNNHIFNEEKKNSDSINIKNEIIPKYDIREDYIQNNHKKTIKIEEEEKINNNIINNKKEKEEEKEKEKISKQNFEFNINNNYINNNQNKKKYIIDDLINDKINIEILKKAKEFCEDKNKIKYDEFSQIVNGYFEKLVQAIIKLNKTKFEKNSIYLNKLITLMCSVFPFLKKNQKDHLLKIDFEDYSINYLKNTLLLNDYEEKKPMVILCNDIEKIKEIMDIIFVESPNQKINIYFAYQLILLYKIIYKNYHKNVKLKLLSFKIKFILSNYTLFQISSEEFSNIYKDLLFMKTFYNTIYFNKIENKYIINGINDKNKNIIYGDKNLEMNYFIYADIDILFDQNENEIYKQIMDTDDGVISHFYRINKLNIGNLIDFSSFYIKKKRNHFMDHIFSLLNIKNSFIYQNIDKYKKNLIKLEGEIFELGKKCLTNNKSNIINQYSRRTKYAEIFHSFSSELHSHIAEIYRDKIKLFPFGSLTEFLSTEESDLDIYLFIEANNKEEKVEIINHIYSKCFHFCKDVEKVISRICLIKFKYKGNEIDLSINGFPPYIHSLLFKEYSLLDARFPLIAIVLKKFSKILNLKKVDYLNSFSWMNLLIAFLQEIIQPPVLPKLYSDNEINNIIYKEIEFSNRTNKNRNKYNDKDKKKTFKDYFETTQKEIVPIPDCLFNKDKIKEIYKKLYVSKNKNKNVEKNKLTCIEIFLKFLEFIIFYLKYDSVFVKSCIDDEGYFNINEIQNIESDDDIDLQIYNYNRTFYNYFTKKYLKFKDYDNKRYIRDGFILIRDPVDGHYNPAQTLRKEPNLECFITTLRYSYSILVKYGSFKKLEELIKLKNEQGSKENLKK